MSSLIFLSLKLGSTLLSFIIFYICYKVYMLIRYKPFLLSLLFMYIGIFQLSLFIYIYLLSFVLCALASFDLSIVAKTDGLIIFSFLILYFLYNMYAL